MTETHFTLLFRLLTKCATDPWAGMFDLLPPFLLSLLLQLTFGLIRIYPTEIVPLYIRSKTISLATLFNWLANFSLTFFTLPGFQHIQWRVCGRDYILRGETNLRTVVLYIRHILPLCPDPCIFPLPRDSRKVVGRNGRYLQQREHLGVPCQGEAE